jgi:hypothetical protein
MGRVGGDFREKRSAADAFLSLEPVDAAMAGTDGAALEKP